MDYIGKLYKTSDNSFAVNISDRSKKSLLAGTLFPQKQPQSATVICNPFPCQVRSSSSKETYLVLDMILVKDAEGNIHSVLFSPNNIIINC